jgi:hypothetical protein
MTPQVTQAIIKTRYMLHLDRDQWRNWALFLARFFLYAAPDSVRAQFTGRPSMTPPDALELAEVFATLYVRAEDEAKAAGLSYLPSDLWTQTLCLEEAHHD